MKIAVLGGGTAGFIAAAHLTRQLPDAELLHVFHSKLPTIGVGEGTTPRFPLWFEEVTGLGLSHLTARCGATLKQGTLLEGWGHDGSAFLNRFHPAHLIGFHFDAADVVKVLGEHVRAELVDKRIEEVRTFVEGVQVRYADGTMHLCDYVIDARGFPGRMDTDTGGAGDYIRLDWVPTGRAIVGALPAREGWMSTRAIARPHGWIFHIPLVHRTGCGYIFNPRFSSDEEVRADFAAFRREDGCSTWDERIGVLNFPNFMHRRMFDGRVFRVGNAASFVEPLEATAIGTAIVQVRHASRWIEEHGPRSSRKRAEIAAFNATLLAYVCRDSLFIAWHYACGSRWDTPFWRYARQGIARARASDIAQSHVNAMQEFVDAGRTLPGRVLSTYDDQGRWQEEIYPLLKVHRPFGNFSELNFAQVGHGIGYYDQRPEMAGVAAGEIGG